MANIVRPFVVPLLCRAAPSSRAQIAQCIDVVGYVPRNGALCVRVSDKRHYVLALLDPSVIAFMLNDPDLCVTVDRLVGTVLILTAYSVEVNPTATSILLLVTGARVMGALGCLPFGNPVDALSDGAVQGHLCALRARPPSPPLMPVSGHSGECSMNTQQVVALVQDCISFGKLGPSGPAGTCGADFVISDSQSLALQDLLVNMVDEEMFLLQDSPHVSILHPGPARSVYEPESLLCFREDDEQSTRFKVRAAMGLESRTELVFQFVTHYYENQCA